MAEMPPHIHQDYLGEVAAHEIFRHLYENSFSIREHNLCVRQIDNAFFGADVFGRGFTPAMFVTQLSIPDISVESTEHTLELVSRIAFHKEITVVINLRERSTPEWHAENCILKVKNLEMARDELVKRGHTVKVKYEGEEVTDFGELFHVDRDACR